MTVERLACPGCQSRMQIYYAGRTELDLCLFCGGLWFDAAELEAVAGASLPVTAGRGAQRACPRCEKPMDRVELRGTEVERCASCEGFYLDSGEVEQLAGQPVRLSMTAPTEEQLAATSQPPRQLRERPEVDFACARCGERFPMASGYAVGRQGHVCERCMGIAERPRPPGERRALSADSLYDFVAFLGSMMTADGYHR